MRGIGQGGAAVGDAPAATSGSWWLADAFLAWVFGVLAVATILTHAAQGTGLSFDVYALATGAAVGAVTVAVATVAWRRARSVRRPVDRLAASLAAALVAAMALLALCSHRPDSDDYFYVPAAVHALARPSEPMGFVVRGITPATERPIVSYNFTTSLPFEYLSAVLAHFSGAEYLAVYYVGMPVLVAAAIATALLALNARLRRGPLATVLGCAVACALLLLMGETHRAYGNLSVTRAFQGKTLLLSAAVPALAAATIGFFRRPGRRSWSLVALTATAMIGMSSTAIVVWPLLALVLVIAVAVARRTVRGLLLPVVLYGLAFAYPAGYTLWYWSTGYARGLRSASSVTAGYPRDFWGHLWLMVDPRLPVWPLLAALGAAIFWRCAAPRARRFVATWWIACAVLYLNPLVAPALIEHVTSRTLYWRLFYLLPVVPTLAAAATLALERLASRRRQLATAAAVVAVAIAAHGVLPRASIFRRATLGRPRYDLPPAVLADARALLALPAPPGGMLAPPELTGVLPMLSADYPQVLRRDDGEKLWLDGGSADYPVTLRRMAATRFADGRDDDFAGFRQVVRETAPMTIVLRPEAWRRLEADGGLAALGYGTPVPVRRLLVLRRDRGATPHAPEVPHQVPGVGAVGLPPAPGEERREGGGGGARLVEHAP